MGKVVRIVSPNVIKSKIFRGSLNHNATSADEAKAAVRLALAAADERRGELKYDRVESGEDGNVVELIPDDKMDQDLTREDLEVKVKLFLKDFSEPYAAEALTAVKKIVETNYLDSLQLSVPTSALSALAIAEQEKPKDDRYEADLKQFIDLYRRVEVWAQKGCIKSIGLCDVELATLSGLYDAVQVKPKSVTLNMASCCVVPTDLQEFSTAKGIKLLTHNDPGVLIADADLDKEGMSVSWIVRYQIMDASRGVLREKRYIIDLQNV